MKLFLKLTDEVIKQNLRQLVLFTFLYRLVAGIFYIKTVNSILRFSLHMAGYSYLTTGNLRAFLLRPVTVFAVIFILFLGMAFMLIETGAMITAYHSSIYLRRINAVSVFLGGMGAAVNEFRKKNWRLLFAVLGNYILMNCYFLVRILTRMKPVNFVLYEILHTTGTRMALVVGSVLLTVFSVPAMMVFFACMLEQKNFKDGIAESRRILKGKWPRAVLLLVVLNLFLILGLVLTYGAVMVIAAVLVTLFAKAYTATAVMATVSYRIEWLLLFIGSAVAVVTDFGAMTVLYHQFGGVSPIPVNEYDFPKNQEGYSRKRWFFTLTAVLSGISAFMVFDMVYNGNSPDQAILSQVEITAHRGSSKHAPENTMAAIKAAIDEMADYSEIDVQLSEDGVPVVCHDLNLARVAGVDVSLKNLTFDQLEQLDVGSHFSSQFAGEKIPSLEEVLEACKGHIRLNIELKSIGTKSPLPEVVAEMIKKMEMEDQCVITSVSLDYLKRIKEAEPELKTGYILAAAYGSYYKNEFVDFISIRSSLVTKKQIQAAHEYGKAIHVWTVNNRSEIEQMALIGVDNIITDYPARAKEVLYQPDVAKNLLTYIRMVMK